MGRGTWKNFEIILFSRQGGFAISKFRGTSEKRHETCQKKTFSQVLYNYSLDHFEKKINTLQLTLKHFCRNRATSDNNFVRNKFQDS